MIYLNYQLAYQQFTSNIDLELPESGLTVIWGESGSGKTTLLRVLAGLEQVSAQVTVNGQVWQDKDQFLAVHKRSLGYVFQQPSLLPHLTVAGNLAYAANRIQTKRVKAKSAKTESSNQLYQQESLLELLNLKHLLNRKVQDLSGGEQQRVAIARALSTQPELLLMDEPLASLDAYRKQEILNYLKALKQQLNIPIIYVCHDIYEAMQLADYMVELKEGQVVQQGPALTVINNLTASSPIEQRSVITAEVVELCQDWQLARAEFEQHSLWISDHGLALGQTVRLLIQAKDVSITLTPHGDSSIQNILPAQIVDIQFDGAQALVKLALAGQYIKALVTRRALDQLKLSNGQQVWLQLKSVAVID